MQAAEGKIQFVKYLNNPAECAKFLNERIKQNYNVITTLCIDVGEY
jgi:hypothetical protein